MESIQMMVPGCCPKGLESYSPCPYLHGGEIQAPIPGPPIPGLPDPPLEELPLPPPPRPSLKPLIQLGLGSLKC